MQTEKYDLFVLDNGHGIDTAGKRSPDGSFLEYEFNRDVVERILKIAENTTPEMLSKFHVLVPETNDIPLGTNSWRSDCRIKRINDIVDSNLNKNVLLLSIHANAAGNGEWKNAKGFGVFYDNKHGKRIEQVAKVYADQIEISTSANLHPYTLRKAGSGLFPTSAKYSIIYFPKCHSLLLELGFMDNKEEVEYLKSNEGREEIALGVFNACVSLLKK